MVFIKYYLYICSRIHDKRKKYMAKLVEELKWGSVLGIAQQRMDMSRAMVLQVVAQINAEIGNHAVGSAEWNRLQRLLALADGVCTSLVASDKILTGLVIDLLEGFGDEKSAESANADNVRE